MWKTIFILVTISGMSLVDEKQLLYYNVFNFSDFLLNEACPLGSYCPLATLNETTGICDP